MNVDKRPYLLRRFIAGLIDYAVIVILYIFYGYAFVAEIVDRCFEMTGLPAFGPFVIWGILSIGVELTLGATMGNTLVNLKPIPLNSRNRKLLFSEFFKRHLLDPIDMYFFGIVAILTVKNSKSNQQLGDMWAQTIVVPENYFIK
ncbi:MAG: RDD family protein [Nonlabens sp.]